MDGSSQEWLQWQQDYAQWQVQYGQQYEMMQQNIGQIPHQTNDFGFQPRGGRGGRGGGIRGGRGRGGQQQQQWSPGGGPNQRGRGWNNSPQNMRRGGANNTGQWGGKNQQNENSWQKPQSDVSWGNQPQQQQWGAQASNVVNQPQPHNQQLFNTRGRGRGGTPRGGGFGKQQELPGPGAAVVVPPQAMLELSRQPPPPPPPQEEPLVPPIPSLIQKITQQSAVEAKEEMSEAEKEFDLQFKNWEEQFNSWKEENKQHPDRQQYEEYERKMEKFREQLLSRREQMKKKREAETKASLNVTPSTSMVNAELAAFTANWEKGPAEDPKPKVNTIQETLKQMANYRPVTGAMPSSIPGLDVDATAKEETLQPPGTEPVENPKPNVPVKEAPTPPSPQAGFVPPANRVNQGHQANNPLPPGHLTGNQPGPLAGNQPSPTARNQPNPMAANQRGPITVNQHSPMGRNQPGPMAENQHSPMAGNKLGPMAGNQPGNMGRNEFTAMGRNQPGPIGGNQLGPMAENQRGPMAGNQPGNMGRNEFTAIGRNQPGPMGRNQPGPMARNQPGPSQGAPFHLNNFRQEQNFFEDDFMDDNQEMAAMHERFSEDSNDGRKNGRSEVDDVGTLPPDFNPWIDLDSDEELPPYMYDQSLSKLAPSEKQQWQGSQGNFQDQGPPRGDFGPPSGDLGPPREDFGPPRGDFGPPRGDFGPPRGDFGPPRGDFGPPRGDFGPSRGDFGPNRMDFGPPRGNFGPQGDAGLRPNDQNQRWNVIRGHDIDDRGRDVDDRLLPQGDNRGPFKPYQEEMFRPDQRPGHGGPPLPSRVEEVDEYKAKTVIEYDHKELNVMTPAMTPATPVDANKKKRVFKAPVKIYDYCHSSESEPAIHTPDPFEYDRTQYVKWEEEERRRHERDRERERWIQEDRRRYSRHRDWDRDRAGRERGEKSDSFPDRDIQRSRDRSEHRYREDRPEKTQDRDERENSSESRPERHPSPKQSRNSRSTNSHSSNQESSSKSSGPPQKIFNIPDEAEKSCIEELLCLPGRVQRPSKFAIFMRGLPGSGKSHVAKLIKDKEVENGGNAPRILNLDDYFMVEVETEVQDPETNRKIKSKEMKYEYEAEMEEAYRQSLVKAFRKTIDEGFFPIIVVDCVNDKVKHFEEMWHYASSKGVKTFVAELPEEASVCAARNEHGRTLQQIEQIAAKWEPTPPNFNKLDVKGLLNNTNTAIEVETEEVSDNEDGTEDIEADDQFSTSWMASRSGPPTGRPPQWKIG
ncbi:Hypothetical predicted protein [Cloeon dipterum]|uniref:YLP motif-containing protein 1 n=1 Tax=Cloeon dipterum TaxID=197152 RepID=A0A8S1D0Y6_9INSE|nr:Hypothetical predicted protein [Cloeon dipterum]